MKNTLTNFRKETRGSVSMEVAFIFPMLFWAFLVCFIWFDSFRLKTTDRQAAETIADIISRETAPIDAAYIEGLHELLDMMTRTTSEPQLVVSTFSKDGEDYVLEWSENFGSGSAKLTDGDIPLLESELPILDDKNTVVIVQTATDYTPIIRFSFFGFDQAINDFQLTQFIRINPRAATRICFETCPVDDTSDPVTPDEPV